MNMCNKFISITTFYCLFNLMLVCSVFNLCLVVIIHAMHFFHGVSLAY